MKKTYFAWSGQTATTGEPNKMTGRMSLYGDFYAFSSRRLRDRFVEENQEPEAYKICVAVNRKTGREYDLGNSVADYNYHLDMISANCCDQPYWE